MRRLLPSLNKTWIIGGAFIAPLLVLVAMEASIFHGKLSDLEHAAPQRAAAPIFTVTQIEGINTVLDAVQSLALPIPVEGSPVHAAILPHHTIIGDRIGEFWSNIAATTHPSVIVVISPAHQNQGSHLVQITDGTWQTPFGDVKTDDDIVSALVDAGVAAREPDSFVNEHGIGVQTPYIAKLYPGVPIVPIIAQAPAGEAQAHAVLNALTDVLPEDALVVASVDFSHYLPAAESDARDAETLGYITSRNYAKIDTLSSDYLDTPFGLDAYLLWSDQHRWRQEFVWHENSGRVTGQLTAPGTSYIVFFAKDAPTGQGVTINAVGDVMLARQVATRLAATTVEAAFGPAAQELDGSNITFANLESVLSTSTVQNSKEIRFEADPARVDALLFMGFTHLSVANNHNEDYGEAAWQESLGYLNAAGIAPIGGYRNDGAPVVATVGTHRVVFVAFEDLIRKVPPEQMVSQVKAASALGDIVVVSIHWGVEYQHEPLASQVELAHQFIDAGADVILGSHPHVLQTVETYHDGLILYSLGNFVFDQIGDDENETVIAHLTLGELGNALTLTPMRIENSFPQPATDAERVSTLNRLASWSDPSLTAQIQSGTIHW